MRYIILISNFRTPTHIINKRKLHASFFNVPKVTIIWKLPNFFFFLKIIKAMTKERWSRNFARIRPIFNRNSQKVVSVYLFYDNHVSRFHFTQNADLYVCLTFGLCNDMANSQPLTDTVECLVPRITPLIDVIIRARPYHVIHSIITGTYGKYFAQQTSECKKRLKYFYSRYKSN